MVRFDNEVMTHEIAVELLHCKNDGESLLFELRIVFFRCGEGSRNVGYRSLLASFQYVGEDCSNAIIGGITCQDKWFGGVKVNKQRV